MLTNEERRRRRFTEEFRREQVELIEQGKITKKEVSELYQVKLDNVNRRLKKYGKKPFPKPILVSTGKEYDLIKHLKEKNEELLRIIGEQKVELIYKSSLLELAREKLGEDFEKK